MSTYHVAIVSTPASWRGGEEQARQLARGLRERGHVCSIIARAGGEFADRMREEGFSVSTFSGRGKSVGAIRSIREHLKRQQVDCLHANDSHALTGAGIASLGMNVPLRIASRRVDFPVRSAWKYRLLCDRVVCVSSAVRRVCQQGGIPSAMLRVVHSGVDPRRMASGDRRRGREALGLKEHQRLLLCVGALTAHKGHDVLLRALPGLCQQYDDLQIALAGEGELADGLAQQAAQLGLASRVRFLGYRTDIPDLMQACDLFAMPSLEEGLGTAVIDAMCARRPIVATTAGGIGELLPSEAVAWRVPPGEPVALAAAIAQALDRPAEAQQKANRAQQHALDRFTNQAMVQGMLEVYRQELESKPFRRAA